MKTLRFFWVAVLITVLPMVNTTKATPFIGGFEHVFDVEQYEDWGKGYLTISDDHFMFVDNLSEAQNWLMTFDTKDHPRVVINGDTIPMTPTIGDLVISVDGKSAKGWTKQHFYNVTDHGNPFVLEYRKKYVADNQVYIRDFTCTIEPITESLQVFDSTLYGAVCTRFSGTSINKPYNIKGDINYRIDNDFDFFYAKTYDFLITGTDPLKDKEILEQIPFYRMVRSTTSPDLLFTVVKNIDESINTTYIPPTSRVINTGSNINSYYNYVTKRTDYVVTQKNKVIQEGGYTQETKTSDLFLEISALDAKKINDPKINYAPIVWQMTYKRHLVNANIDAQSNLKAIASWAHLPIEDRICEFDFEKKIKSSPLLEDFLREEYRTYSEFGIIFNKLDHTIIDSIVPGSLADKAGLIAGDVIVGATSPAWDFRDNCRFFKLYKQKQGGRELWNSIDWDLTIRRNKKRVNIYLPTQFIQISNHRYLAAPKTK